MPLTLSNTAIEVIAIGSVPLVGVICGTGIKLVWNRVTTALAKIEENAKITQAKFDEIEKDVESKFSIHGEKVLNAIKELSDNFIPMRHCSDKQTLWQERFDNMMTVNSTDHLGIASTISQLVSEQKESINKQDKANDAFIQELKELQKCVQRLSLGEDNCD